MNNCKSKDDIESIFFPCSFKENSENCVYCEQEKGWSDGVGKELASQCNFFDDQ